MVQYACTWVGVNLCLVPRRHRLPASHAEAVGVLYLVATPIGNLRDITLRALDVLRDASLIAAEDTRRTASLLLHYGIRTPTCSLHEHNEHRRTPSLVKELEQGRSIALVTDAGTPLVSDPGARLVGRCLDAGIRVEPVPGPSAVLAALAMAGMPTSQFTFLGFPPGRSNERKKWLSRLAGMKGTLVAFESPHRIRQTLGDMAKIIGDVDVAVCREVTKIHEELVKGPIADVLRRLRLPRGEFTIVFEGPGNVCDSGTDLPSDDEISDEFCRMTNNIRSRREQVRRLARKYGLSVRDVYQRIERAKT